MGALEDILYDLLIWIHGSVGLTWAWSIIALTALVRVALMPLTVKQTRSMLSMQRLQPYMKQIQQKYQKDPQARNQAMMEFYRDNKVNPAASCFPLLLQLPIFFGLFFVLRDFSKNPPKGDDNFSFLFGFIENILVSVKDGGWQAIVLLVFYVGSQLFSSKIMMTSNDPRQKIIMYLLPIVFVPFILGFPIGLMLYWITTNLWTLGQYVVVVRLTDVSGEIILPADKKGNKRTVVPKADKAKGAGQAGDTAKKDEKQDSKQAKVDRQVDGNAVRRNRKRR
jgi:YidC/Oxa1 family membrane protein insertase